MSDPQNSGSPVWRGLMATRTLAAWIALAAAVSLAIVIAIIYYKYPYANYVPSPPNKPLWMVTWRNVSILTGLIAGLLSLPKWQSLVAILAVVLLVVFGMMTSH